MTRTDQLKEITESLNARDFVGAGKHFSERVAFHAPGLGLDMEGREAMLTHIGDFVQQADVRYEVEDVVEHGPFVVGFARSTGTIGSERVAWDLCQVMRYEGDQVAEVWALRGGSPQPTSST